MFQSAAKWLNWRGMSPAARTVAAYGVFLFLVGLSLFAIPNLTLPIFGLDGANLWSTRLLGWVITVLGLYYIQAARQNQVQFFRMTSWGRPLILVGMVILVLWGYASPVVLLIGLADTITGLITWRALRKPAQ